MNVTVGGVAHILTLDVYNGLISAVSPSFRLMGIKNLPDGAAGL